MPSRLELFIVFALYTILYFSLYQKILWFSYHEEHEIKLYIFCFSILLISFIVYIILLFYRFPILVDMTRDAIALLRSSL